jgi:murein DD-endopeptidase MepM/ murein hydrolase activator NlpD
MRWGMAGVMLVLAACSSEAAEPQQSPAPESQLADTSPIAIADAPVICNPVATQGGAVLCRTPPLATVLLDGMKVAIADADGLAVVGLTRTQETPATISVKPVLSETITSSATVEVLKRTDTVATFEMECARIAPQSAADRKKAEISWVKKDEALRIFSSPLAPFALVKPAEGVYSSPFGATRTYVPKTKTCEGSTSVHNGQDIAIGTGTEVRAPMAGTVILADPDLFYEGGCVFLDLGRGLVSITMHLSRVDVKAGDKVAQGQLLGLSGATGRVTGPHLHWAIKYRNATSDDRGTDIWLDPLLMLQLREQETVIVVHEIDPSFRPITLPIPSPESVPPSSQYVTTE